MAITKQPRKQRKRIYDAPLHRRQKFCGARLAEDLQEEFGRRTLGVRKGDTVEVMRGDFKGHRGRVEKVNLISARLFVEGVTVPKADGSEKFYPIHPSNVMLVKLELKDEKRAAKTKRGKVKSDASEETRST